MNWKYLFLFFLITSTLSVSQRKLSSKPLIEEIEPITLPDEHEEAKRGFSFMELILLVLLCYFVTFLLRQTQFAYLQPAGATILIGMFVGMFIRFVGNVERLRDAVSLDSEVFFFILLPPIIFESGYTLERVLFQLER
jgi:hypothetical protein